MVSFLFFLLQWSNSLQVFPQPFKLQYKHFKHYCVIQATSKFFSLFYFRLCNIEASFRHVFVSSLAMSSFSPKFLLGVEQNVALSLANCEKGLNHDMVSWMVNVTNTAENGANVSCLHHNNVNIRQCKPLIFGVFL